MRMELEGEVKELEAQLEAKRAALGEVRRRGTPTDSNHEVLNWTKKNMLSGEPYTKCLVQ